MIVINRGIDRKLGFILTDLYIGKVFSCSCLG